MPSISRALHQLGFAGRVIQGISIIIPPLCQVPAGTFLMGSDPEHDQHAAIRYELPQHLVSVEGFEIGKYPVTVTEYACAVHAKAVRIPPDCMDIWWDKQLENKTWPVVCVSWRDAVAYCSWVTALTGEQWRLPTEAEWEKAARGTDRHIYPWGDQWDQARANTDESLIHHITSIDAYPNNISPYGVVGMVGNIWEWCHSLAEPYPYRASDGREDTEVEGRRALRGGSWAEPFTITRTAFRYDDDADFPLSHAGFRLVRGNANSR